MIAENSMDRTSEQRERFSEKEELRRSTISVMENLLKILGHIMKKQNQVNLTFAGYNEGKKVGELRG